MKESDRRRLRQKKKQVRQKGRAELQKALEKLDKNLDLSLIESFGRAVPCNTTT